MTVKGTVTGFQQRSEQIQTASGIRMNTVWTFRLERFGPDKAPLPRATVQLSGLSIVGSINNGDVVEVEGAYEPGQVIVTDRVKNLTAGATVHARAASKRGLFLARAFKVVAFMLIAAVGIVVVGTIVSGFR